MKKSGFSIVELIISISILIILSIVATTANNNIKNNSYNTKVISDLSTIESALITYSDGGNHIPLPDGNNNNFSFTGTYVHDYENGFGTYGKFSEDTLAKIYIDSTPLDPRTNQYYSYGITKDSNQFELAGVIYDKEDDTYFAKVTGNYTGEEGVFNLIKEYNGNSFVSDKGYNLPYNPYNKILVATDLEGNTYQEGDTIENNSGTEMEIFFSDGSTSIIEDGTIITLNKSSFPGKTNLTSNISIFLEAGTIWTKATRLDKDSSFEVYTTDTTASVRGTIFAISYKNNETSITLQEGSLEITVNGSESYFLNTPSYLDEYISEQDGKIIFTNEYIIADEETGEETIQETIEPKTIIVNGTTIFGTTDSIYINEDKFSIPSIRYITPVENYATNIYLDEVIEETKNDSCYLGGEIIENGESIQAYENKYVKYGENCGSTKTRKCIDGNLNGNKDYKYTSCVVKDPNQCYPYEKDSYTGGSVTDQGSIDEVYKTQSVTLSGVEVGNIVYKREVECRDNGKSYDIVSENIESFTCNPTLTQDTVNNTCYCATGTTFSTTSATCEAPVLYTGYGCDSCPFGYIKTDSSRYGHKYRKCKNIYNGGDLPVCAKREGLFKKLKNKSWSGYTQ